MSLYANNRKALRLVPQETVLLVCDLQDPFRFVYFSTIIEGQRTSSGHVCFAEVTTAVKRLIQAVKVLGLQIFVSEHQPAGKCVGSTPSFLTFVA